jgi:ABC-type branched-subunit amino acid transport system substrate-binding protein/outer membrane protein assembly factor BamD (BamD/ComL family)
MKRVIFLVILICVNCAHTIEREGKKIPIKEAFYYDLKKGIELMKSERYDEAIKAFEWTISFYENEVDVGEALYYLGYCHLKIKNYESAERYFKMVIEKSRATKFIGKSYMRLYEISRMKSNYEEAIYYLKNVISLNVSDKPLYYWKFKLGELYFLSGDFNNAFLTFLEGYNDAPSEELKELFKSIYTKIFLYYIPESEKGNLNFFPEEEREWRSEPTRDAHKIGVILPLSGKFSPIGEHILKGLEFGLKIYEPNSPFEIFVEDIGEEEIKVVHKFKNLIEKGVSVVVGPPSTLIAKIIAPYASLSKTIFITFSLDETILENNPYLIRFFISKKTLASYLADYIIDELSIKSMAIFYPDDSYGGDMTNFFWDEFTERGGEIKGIEGYMPNQKDFSEEIKKVLGLYYIEEREEYKEGMDFKKIPPVIDFEGIFIPDTIKVLSYLIPQLEYFDVDTQKIYFFGTYLWDVQEILKIPKKFKNNIIFVSGYNPYSERPETKEFINKFSSVYKENPNIFSAYASDLGEVLYKILFSKNHIKSEEIKKELSSMGEFNGATGKIKVTPDGNLIHPVYIIKYRDIEP